MFSPKSWGKMPPAIPALETSQPEIPQPESVSPVPDKFTKQGFSDFTGPSAENRVLHINLGFFRYGTSDKIHAAAMVLSLLLFLAIGGVFFSGIWLTSAEWPDKVFSWLSSTFLFVTGVALGKGAGSDKQKDDFD